MLTLEFGDKEVVSFPFRQQERKIVGNDPVVEVYLADGEDKYHHAPLSEFSIIINENEIVVSFNSKKKGIIKVR